MDPRVEIAIAALRASGSDREADVVKAILSGPELTPSAGSASVPAELHQAASDPANARALEEARSGGQSDLERFSRMTSEQLASLPEDQYLTAIKLLKDG